jgi:hypothetical protein
MMILPIQQDMVEASPMSPLEHHDKKAADQQIPV